MIMDIYSVAQNGTLDEVIAACSEDQGPKDVCNALELYKRLDLLRECLEKPDYKEFAQEEINRIEWWKKLLEEQKKKEDAYPAIFKTWNEVLRKSQRIGICSVSYPSATAIRHDLGENYVAISGDGLWMYHFEILSMDEGGRFRLSAHPTGKDVLGKTFRESSESALFRKTANCNFGDELTGDQILNFLTEIYST